MDYVYSREKGEDKTKFMLLVVNEQKKNFSH